MCPCPICKTPTEPEQLVISGYARELHVRLERENPGWKVEDGACPRCTRRVFAQLLMERGDAELYRGIQTRWPLNAEIAFGALPVPIRLHVDPRFNGRGVTIALVDSGFYPIADLTRPVNRICAWVNAGVETMEELRFGPDSVPEWTDWNGGLDPQWHGLMTSTVAAGNGWLSHGIFGGLASQARLVLVQARDPDGRISNESIVRALSWLKDHREEFNVRVISLSVGGDPVKKLKGNIVDEAIEACVNDGVVVVAAAGNGGVRRLVPPATSPRAITVGGIDDHNEFHPDDLELWHSNYGRGQSRVPKPEIVAPSMWVAAPLLPCTPIAAQAHELFVRRKAGDTAVEERIKELKLVTAYYQSVDGTSFAAPIVSSVIATMLEANPTLAPQQVCEILTETAQFVEGAPRERQGAGVIQPALAVSRALRAPGGPLADFPSAAVTRDGIEFVLYDWDAKLVQVFGSWNNWQTPEALSSPESNGIWLVGLDPLPPGRYVYKFLLDSSRWIDDPENPLKMPDQFGGWNSVLVVER